MSPSHISAAFVSTNSITQGEQVAPLWRTLWKYGVEIEDISPETIPEDFARTPKIHKCYLVRRG